MKSFFLLALLFAQQALFAQWNLLGSPSTEIFSSVHFTSNDTGFVAGLNGIFHTTDGGANWTTAYAADSLDIIEDIFIPSSSLAVAVGQDFGTGISLILRTQNGGASWDEVPTTSMGLLNSVFFVDDLTGYIAGSHGIVLKTENGGASWTQQNSGTISSLKSVFFVDALHGFAVGGGPGSSRILRTIDGGAQWNEVTVNTDSYLQSVFFTDAQTGYIVGWEGEILKTTDAGATWGPQTSVHMAGNLEVFFTDALTGYIVGWEQSAASIQQTTDGGQTWVETAPDLEAGLVSIYFPSPEIGYAVGAQGTILKTTTGGLTTTVCPPFRDDLRLYPNPARYMLYLHPGATAIKNLRIFDHQGTLRASVAVDDASRQVDISGFGAGNYYVVMETAQGRRVEKIVKL
jgi:photosystem II stability/assembly factor-like uncharacterized protein